MEDNSSNGMFIADAAPPTQQTNPTGRPPVRSQKIVPPRRAAEPPMNTNARRNNVVPPRRPP